MNPTVKRWTHNAAVAFGIVALCVGVYALITEPGVLRRFFHDVVERPSGPMSFRFLLQPVMAIIAAWKDSRKDAATGHRRYFVSLLTDPEHRSERLREGLRSTGKIMMMGVIMDLAYQAIVLKHFYPNEAILVAILLAFVPYMLLRGPLSRIKTR